MWCPPGLGAVCPIRIFGQNESNRKTSAGSAELLHYPDGGTRRQGQTVRTGAIEGQPALNKTARLRFGACFAVSASELGGAMGSRWIDTCKPGTAWHLVKEAFSDWSRDHAPRLGAALAYYT